MSKSRPDPATGPNARGVRAADPPAASAGHRPEPLDLPALTQRQTMEQS